MKEFETENVLVKKLAENIVLVEAKYGVEINKEKSLRSNQMIVDEMGQDYGMIVDRKLDYSIDPVSIYQLLNSIEPLRAIAIVLHKESHLSMIAMEQKLFKGPLEVFWNINDAKTWLENTLKKLAEPVA